MNIRSSSREENKAALSRQANIRRVIFGKRAAQIAAAAVIIVAAGLLIIYRNLPVPQWPQQQTASVAKSPVEMLTPISLRNAYLVGGMEAVDEQNRKAFQMLNRKQVKVSIHELHLQIETDGM